MNATDPAVRRHARCVRHRWTLPKRLSGMLSHTGMRAQVPAGVARYAFGAGVGAAAAPLPLPLAEVPSSTAGSPKRRGGSKARGRPQLQVAKNRSLKSRTRPPRRNSTTRERPTEDDCGDAACAAAAGSGGGGSKAPPPAATGRGWATGESRSRHPQPQPRLDATAPAVTPPPAPPAEPSGRTARPAAVPEKWPPAPGPATLRRLMQGKAQRQEVFLLPQRRAANQAPAHPADRRAALSAARTARAAAPWSPWRRAR